MWRLLLAFKCFFLVLFARRLPPEAVELLPPPDLAPPRLPPPEADVVADHSPTSTSAADGGAASSSSRAPAPPPPSGDEPRMRAEAEQRGALLLLGVLQREGRLLDFLQESVDGYTDGQIGAAVRDIHRGCRKALAEHLTIEPVLREPDNATIKIDSGFDPSRIRLVGNVVGSPPFVGTLRHPGWRGTGVKLPVVPATHDPSVIAPAEVEL